jgi:hypothetical protein
MHAGGLMKKILLTFLLAFMPFCQLYSGVDYGADAGAGPYNLKQFKCYVTFMQDSRLFGINVNVTGSRMDDDDISAAFSYGINTGESFVLKTEYMLGKFNVRNMQRHETGDGWGFYNTSLNTYALK